MRRYGKPLCIVLALLAAGCAGRQFVKPPSEALVLGRTSYGEITKQLGEPQQQLDFVKNGHSLKGIAYRYITAFGRPNVYPAREMRVFFLNDVLVGYDYTSSYLEDKTDFEEDHVYRIQKGETTKGQVMQLLGTPGGTYMYPMVSNKTETGLVYRYFKTEHQPFQGLRIRDKLLIVSLDSADHVAGVEFIGGK